jgi:hypothetical protein
VRSLLINRPAELHFFHLARETKFHTHTKQQKFNSSIYVLRSRRREEKILKWNDSKDFRKLIRLNSFREYTVVFICYYNSKHGRLIPLSVWLIRTQWLKVYVFSTTIRCKSCNLLSSDHLPDLDMKTRTRRPSVIITVTIVIQNTPDVTSWALTTGTDRSLCFKCGWPSVQSICQCRRTAKALQKPQVILRQLQPIKTSF